jgi:hypothetical protein
MCFGGDRGETVVIRKRERPRYRDSYVGRPEVASYRCETITRRSTSAHRPSYDEYRYRKRDGRSRSRSRITEERRVYRRD